MSMLQKTKWHTSSEVSKIVSMAMRSEFYLQVSPCVNILSVSWAVKIKILHKIKEGSTLPGRSTLKQSMLGVRSVLKHYALESGSVGQQDVYLNRKHSQSTLLSLVTMQQPLPCLLAAWLLDSDDKVNLCPFVGQDEVSFSLEPRTRKTE